MKVSIKLTRDQRRFLHAILNDDFVEIVGYGGARGGGKTFISVLAMVLRRMKYARSKGLMLRLTQGAADQNIGEEVEKVLRLLGIPIGPKSVHWVESDKQWVFPNGSYIQLGYCKNEKDWQRWQGQQFMDLCFEEATQFKERVFLDIIASNRNGDNYGVGGKIWITCNPGGLGTGWVKKRFIDSKTRDRRTLWLKALLRDNMALLENDPGYEDRTLAKQPEWRRKQWIDGDWESVEGSYWVINSDPATGIVREVAVPDWADLYCGVDAGFWPSAFACVWVAKWRDERGKLRVHVWRVLKKHKLNTSQQTEEALAIEKDLRFYVKARFADPAAWKRTEAEGGISATTAHQWATNGFVVSAAYSNARVSGWMMIRTAIDAGILTIDPSCYSLLREFEEAIHDDKSDDMKEPCEDHCLDALRYVVVSIFAGTAPSELEDPIKKADRLLAERRAPKIVQLQPRR